jgi:hypothetical protein
MQLEFSFVSPFNEAVEKAEREHNQKWNDLFRSLSSLIPKDFDWNGIFDEPPMNESNKEMFSIPMTIIVGERNQLIFPFMREIYEQYWGLPVEFHSEVHP